MRHWEYLLYMLPWCCSLLQVYLGGGKTPDWYISTNPKHIALASVPVKSGIFQSNSTVVITNEAPKSQILLPLGQCPSKPWVAKIMSQLPRPYPAACLSAVRSCFQTFLCEKEGWKLLLQEWKLRLVFSLFVPSWDLNTSFTFVKCWINQESWQAWEALLCWVFEGMESKLQPRIWTLVGLKFSFSLLKLLLLWNIFWT